MDQNTLYDVLIGIDQAGSTQEINKTLKEMAKSLNIEDVPIRVGSKNLLSLTESIRKAISEGFNPPEAQINKLASQWANHLQKSMSTVDLKKVLNTDVLNQPALPKNFFGAGQLNNLKAQLDELSKRYSITVQSFSKNAEGQISALVTGLDALGNKTSFILKDSGEGFTRVSTIVKSEFDKIFKTQVKTIEGFGAKIATAMKQVQLNPDSEVYKNDLKELNLAYQVLLSNLKDVAKYNEYDSAASKEAKLRAIAVADEANQKKIIRQNELQTEKEAAAIRKEAFTKQKALVKDLQTAISNGNIAEEQEVRRLMGINQKKFQQDKSYVDQIASLKAAAEKTGGLKLAESTRDDLEKAITTVGRFSKNYTEALEKNGVVSEDFASKIKILQNEILEYEKRISTLKGKGLISEEEENDLRSYVATLKNLTDETKLAEKAAQDFANQYGQAITPKTAANTKDLVQAFLKAEEAGDKTGQAAKDLARHVGAVGKVSIESRADMTSYNDVVRIIGVTSTDAEGRVKKLSYAYKESAKQLHLMKTEYPSVNKLVKNLGEQITGAAKKIALWGLSTKIVYGVWNAFKEGIGVVEEVDKELTQIAVVSGTTRESVKHLGAEFAATAVAMSQTVADVAKLNTELVRQGLNLEESAQRADTIMKLSAAGAITMEQSLAVITSGVNALGVSHEKIADVLLKAANVTASDVEGLGEAFTKTASGAKAAGLSIEQTTAILATMKDVTQEGDSQLGTSLKSILARFNRINEETGLYNEELNKTQTAIESVGVSFTDSEGQIRNTYDILADLSLIWDDLDRNTQAYIATQAAGTRQQNRFFAIMQNFNSVQGVHNDLLDSAGTLQKAYTVYVSSSEAASKRFKASLEKFWINFIDSDVLIFLKDVASTLLELADAIGGFGLAAGGVTALILKMGGAFSAIPVKEFAKAITALIPGITSTAATAGAATGAMGGLGAAASAAGKLIMTAFPPLLAIAAVAVAIGLVTKALGEAKREAEELKKAQTDIYNDALAVTSSKGARAGELKDLGEDYLNLKAKIAEAGGAFALTKEELETYYSSQARIKEILPDTESYIDSQGRTILKNVTALDQLIAKEKEYQTLQAKAGWAGAAAAWEEKKALLDDELKKTKETHEKIVQAEENARVNHAQAVAASKNSPNNKSFQNWANQTAQAYHNAIEATKQSGEALVKAGQASIEGYWQILEMGFAKEEITLPENFRELFQTEPFAIEVSTKSADEALLYLKDNIALLNNEAATFKIGGEDTSMPEFMADLDELQVKMANGELSGAAFTAEIDKFINALKESGVDIPLFDALILNLENMKAGIEGTEVSLEALAVKEAEIAFKQDEQAKASIANYQAQTDKVKNYSDTLDLIKEKGIQSPEVSSAIQNGHLNLVRFLNDEIALTSALKTEQQAAKETQLQAYADLMFSDQAYRDTKNSGWADLTAQLKTLYNIDANQYMTAQETKAKINTQVKQKVSQEDRAYFQMVNDQYVLQGEKYEQLQRQLSSSDAGKREAARAKIAELQATMVRLQAAYDTGAISVDEYNRRLREEAGLLTDTTNATISKEQALQSASNMYQGAQSKIEGYQAALRMLNDTESTQADITNLILSQYPEFAGMLGNKTALSKAFTAAIKDEANTQTEAYRNMLMSTGTFVLEKGSAYDHLISEVSRMYGVEDKNFATVEEAKLAINAAILKKMGGNYTEFFIATAKGIELTAKGLENLKLDLKNPAVASGKIIDESRTTPYISGITSAFSRMNKEIDVSTGLWDQYFKGIKMPNFEKMALDIKKINPPKETENAAKKTSDAAKKTSDAAKKTSDAAKKTSDAAKEKAKAAEKSLELTKEEVALRKEIEALKVAEASAKLSEEVFNIAKEFLEWQKELLTEEITKALEAEKEGLLEALDLEEERLKKAEEYNNYLKERKALQDSIANLEYRAALASLDSSVGGRTNQRDIAEQLEAERANLVDVEENRIKTIQDEEFAKRRAKIEAVYVEWLRLAEAASQEELTDAELLKLQQMANDGDVHAARLLKMAAEYTQEQMYLDSLAAIQSGMIKTLTGEMIPLEEAFKRLNIENGKFWTFFGQKEVDNFKTKVANAIEAVKKYGLAALQQWEDLSAEIKNAEDKLQEYLDSIKNADTTVPPPKTSSSGTTSTGTSSGSTSTKTSTPKVPPAPQPPIVPTSYQAKRLQWVINKAADYSSKDDVDRVTPDGVFGPETAREVHDMVSAFFDYGKRYGSMNLASTLRAAANKRSISQSVVDKIAGLTFPRPSPTTSGGGGSPVSKPTLSMYADGGKADYTGLAMVHGSKTKPEYVFNYPQFKDLAKMIASNQFADKQGPKIQFVPQRIEVKVGNLVNVEGSVTQDIMPKLERVTENAMTELKRTIKGWGK